MKQRLRFGAYAGMIPVILRLAWPTMLEQLMQTLVQYIDTAMVGSLGTEATAAVGATATVNWLIGSTVSAFGIGFLTFIARALGCGDRERAARVASQSTLAVLFAGTLFTVLPLTLYRQVPVWMRIDTTIRDTAARYFFILYTPMLFRAATVIYGTALRAAGDTRTPMRVGVLVNLVNVVLNFLLIYPTRELALFGTGFTMPGAGMGVIGAAVASAAAYVFGGICITRVLWRHPLISPRGRQLKPDPEILKPCLKVAIPNMLQRFATSFGYVAFASMINSLGEVSTAAHTIANTVESAFYVPGYGMQTAAATLSGNALGAKDEKKMRLLSRTAVGIEVALMLLSGGLLFAFAPAMAGLFTRDERVLTLCVTVLRMVAVSEPFYGVSIIIEGMMQGVGETVKPLICGISTMWIVRIGGTFLCISVLGRGLTAAWGCMIAHNMTMFLLMLILYLRGSWNPLRADRLNRPEP